MTLLYIIVKEVEDDSDEVIGVYSSLDKFFETIPDEKAVRFVDDAWDDKYNVIPTSLDKNGCNPPESLTDFEQFLTYEKEISKYSYCNVCDKLIKDLYHMYDKRPMCSVECMLKKIEQNKKRLKENS